MPIVKLLIEFDGKELRVPVHPDNIITCFGMLEMAKFELNAQIQGHTEKKKIIPMVTARTRVPYPPEPK